MMPKLHKQQTGLSLIELMVAMVLSLLLILGVLQIFLSSKNTYTTNQGLSELQESGRFALDLMARDIRNASYKGQCFPRTDPGVWAEDVEDFYGWASGNAPEGINASNSTGILIQHFTNTFPDDPDPERWCETDGPHKLAYYVKDSVLHRRDEEGAHELVTNVNSVDFRYATRTSDTIYKNTNEITNWADVVAVEVTLTVQAEPALEREFYTVIGLRNRLP